ncbi:MAG: hypothetical protein JF631_14475 [Mycobacterium sp.]|nr:hypothetical protein [Mycobacterium sp.]
MKSRTAVRTVAGYLAGGAALTAVGYAAYAATAWTRYGHARRPRGPEEEDPFLDELMPHYDIVERHHVQVAAPAAITLGAARDFKLVDSCVVRAIFMGREMMLGSEPAGPPPPQALLAAALSMGWGILVNDPDREIVLGAVTRPWEANPVFRALPPSEFVAFAEPGYVKIAWTLRADPIGTSESIFRTETRAIATDTAARDKFRRYWAMVSPGVALIRRAMLAPVKADAERRAGATLPSPEVVTMA